MKSTLSTLLLFTLSSLVYASTPPINYQMRLTDSGGQPTSGNVNVSVAVYTNLVGPAPLYTEAVGSQTANNGILSFQFGAHTNFPPVLTHAEVYLEVSIDGTPMVPRQRLVAVPYAIHASSVQGNIVLENNTDPSPAPGTMRWNDGFFEGYNGSEWTLLSSPNPFFIQTLSNQLIDEDSTTGPLGFEIGDPDNPAEDLTVTVTADPAGLADFTVNGTGAVRDLIVTPFTDVTDSMSISVRVSDGDNTKTDTFQLTINAINDRPTVTHIADQVTQSGSTLFPPITFFISDVETAPSNLLITVTSTNTTLMHPTNSFALLDPDSFPLVAVDNARYLSLSPIANQVGMDLVTVTVSDGDLSTNETFTLTVNNRAPQFQTTPSPPQTNLEYGFPDSAADFSYSITTSDPENHPRFLSAVSKPSELSLSSSNGNGTLSGSLSSGTYHVTLKVQDSYGDSTTQTFTINVNQ